MRLPSKPVWLFLLSLAVAGSAAVADEAVMPMPAWFTPLDQAPLGRGDARGNTGKGFMLFFWMEACGYCERMVNSTLRYDDVASSVTTTFDAIGLNLFDDAPLPWLAGEQSSGRLLALRYRVQTTPTTVFIDAAGNELNRVVGYLPARSFAREIQVAARRKR